MSVSASALAAMWIVPTRRASLTTSSTLAAPNMASVGEDPRTCGICGWNLAVNAVPIVEHSGSIYLCSNCSPVTDSNASLPTLVFLPTL